MAQQPSAVSSALAASLPHSVGPEATKLSSTNKFGGQRTPLRFRHPEASNEDVDSSGDDEYSDEEGSTTAVETSSPDDNYVRKTLAKEKPLPPISWSNWYREINIVSTLALSIVPVLAIYGALTTPLQWKTAVWAVIYYFMTGLGITAGYHRLWAHRSYTASLPLQYLLALWGSGAVEGSIKWWSRGHRAHHRYTDTDLDPYSAHKGLLWSHIGWMIVKPRRKPGVTDVSDLSANPVVKWQHRWYLPLIFGMGFVFPTVVAGLGWGDWRGGYFFAGAARLLFVHHSTFCVNSLAHWLGEAPFDDRDSPRDHWVTSLVTLGEGYHNFHHQYPSDFRNAIRWYQWDPTKWFIAVMFYLGLASQLRVFPDNEIKKGQVAMRIKELSRQCDQEIRWPTSSNHLPTLSWDEFQAASKERDLIVIGGYIHDVSEFQHEHPGGLHWIKLRLGKDATSAFYGGTYDHSNAASNLLAMLRVGCIRGGCEVESLKQYSEVIEAIKVSGGNAVLNARKPQHLVQIKQGSEQATGNVTALNYKPDFTSTDLTAGLQA